MGDLTPQDINQNLIGRFVTLHSPYFPALPEKVEGIVTYIENDKAATKIVIQQAGVGYMEVFDTKHYEFKEIED